MVLPSLSANRRCIEEEFMLTIAAVVLSAATLSQAGPDAVMEFGNGLKLQVRQGREEYWLQDRLIAISSGPAWESATQERGQLILRRGQESKRIRAGVGAFSVSAMQTGFGPGPIVSLKLAAPAGDANGAESAVPDYLWTSSSFTVAGSNGQIRLEIDARQWSRFRSGASAIRWTPGSRLEWSPGRQTGKWEAFYSLSLDPSSHRQAWNTPASSGAQVAPFEFFTRGIYDFRRPVGEVPALAQRPKPPIPLQWWTDQWPLGKVGAPDGKGRVTWTRQANLARAAWGMAWWSRRQGQPSWLDRAEQTMRLLLSSPGSELPGGYVITTNQFVPASLSDQADTALWLRQWAELLPNSSLNGEAERRLAAFETRLAAARAMTPTMILYAASLPDTPGNRTLRAKALSGLRVGARGQTLAEASDLARAAARLAPGDPGLAGSRLESWARGSFRQELPWRARMQVFGSIPQDGVIRASQARDSISWLEAGSIQKDSVLFRHGVWMLRSSLALHQHNNAGFLVDLPRAQIQGRMAGGYDMRTDQILPWQGFEAGEGQLLASLAEADVYGGVFQSAQGWRVGVDAVNLDSAGRAYNAVAETERGFQFPPRVEEVTPLGRTRIETLVQRNVIRRIQTEWTTQGLALVARPTDTSAAQQESAAFLLAGGLRLAAVKGPRGWTATVNADRLSEGAVRLETRSGGQVTVSSPFWLAGTPDFSIDARGWNGWRGIGSAADAPRAGLRAGGVDWLFVGSRSDTPAPGEFRSAAFYAAMGMPKLLASGVGGRVELREAEGHGVLKRIDLMSPAAQRVTLNADVPPETRLYLAIVADGPGWAAVRDVQLESGVLP